MSARTEVHAGLSPARHAEDHNMSLSLHISAQWQDTLGVPADSCRLASASQCLPCRAPLASMIRQDAGQLAQGVDTKAPMQPLPRSIVASKDIHISVKECNPDRDVVPTGACIVAESTEQGCCDSFNQTGCYAGTITEYRMRALLKMYTQASACPERKDMSFAEAVHGLLTAAASGGQRRAHANTRMPTGPCLVRSNMPYSAPSMVPSAGWIAPLTTTCVSHTMPVRTDKTLSSEHCRMPTASSG